MHAVRILCDFRTKTPLFGSLWKNILLTDSSHRWGSTDLFQKGILDIASEVWHTIFDHSNVSRDFPHSGFSNKFLRGMSDSRVHMSDPSKQSGSKGFAAGKNSSWSESESNMSKPPLRAAHWVYRGSDVRGRRLRLLLAACRKELVDLLPPAARKTTTSPCRLSAPTVSRARLYLIALPQATSINIPARACGGVRGTSWRIEVPCKKAEGRSGTGKQPRRFCYQLSGRVQVMRIPRKVGKCRPEQTTKKLHGHFLVPPGRPV